MKLNLGAADRHFDGYVSVDIAPPADVIADLSLPWPWETSSIEEVLALDVAEHIGDCNHAETVCSACYEYHTGLVAMLSPKMQVTDGRGRHPLGRIHFMNELHRVLIPGGHATIETPNAARGVGYIQDPTHCSPYCLSTFKYFEHGSFAHQRLAKSYGITAAFRVVAMSDDSLSNGEDEREQVWKIRAVLEALK